MAKSLPTYMHTYVIENSTNYPLHRKRSQAYHIGFTRIFFLNVEAWISLKSIQNSDEQAYPREKKTVHTLIFYDILWRVDI